MISIALTTYNGEKYINDQLVSILNQTLPPDEVIICDDGSTDATISIIEEIASKDSKVKLFRNDAQLGVAFNFQKAISICKGDYIALCDQDDIWKENKLKLSLEKLKEIEKQKPNEPILIHTDLEVVDESLNLISKSFWQYTGLNPKILKTFNFLGVCNGITGCTVLFNKKTKEYIFPFPAEIIMHDGWIGLCVAKYGVVSFIEEQTVKYRQHGNNTIGAKHNKKSKYVWLKNINSNIEFNKHYYRMIRKLNYGSPLKYVLYKIVYAIIRP